MTSESATAVLHKWRNTAVQQRQPLLEFLSVRLMWLIYNSVINTTLCQLCDPFLVAAHVAGWITKGSCPEKSALQMDISKPFSGGFGVLHSVERHFFADSSKWLVCDSCVEFYL